MSKLLVHVENRIDGKWSEFWSALIAPELLPAVYEHLANTTRAAFDGGTADGYPLESRITVTTATPEQDTEYETHETAESLQDDFAANW